MSIPARTIPPEAMDEARRLYEHTRVPVQRIADLLGISKSTLNLRIPRWGWKRRTERIPEGDDAGVVAVASPPVEPLPPAEPVAPLPREKLIARLVARIETEIAAVERLVARAGLDAGADGAADTERAARTLAILVRSLRELAALERGQAPDDEEAERDADAYRRELEATLERVLAGGAAA